MEKGPTKEKNSVDISEIEAYLPTKLKNKLYNLQNSQHNNIDDDHCFGGNDPKIEENLQTSDQDSEELYYCHSCKFKSRWEHVVNRHTLSVHQGNRYPCDTCVFEATQATGLRRHMYNVYS